MWSLGEKGGLDGQPRDPSAFDLLAPHPPPFPHTCCPRCEGCIDRGSLLEQAPSDALWLNASKIYSLPNSGPLGHWHLLLDPLLPACR